MNRADLLKRATLLAGGALIGRALPIVEDAPAAALQAPTPVSWDLCRVRVTELGANGGICAPLSPYYAMPVSTLEARPIRDALPAFTSTRSGVTLPACSSMSA